MLMTLPYSSNAMYLSNRLYFSFIKVIILLTITVHNTSSHPRFRRELPNMNEEIPGKKVLGHTSDTYIQDLDVFGESFRKAGFKWTKEFCQEDSDGDGQSNGFELGDPFCCFIKDDTTRYRGATNYALSDPGDPESKSSRAEPCKFCEDKCSDNSGKNIFENNNTVFMFLTLTNIMLLIMKI